MLSASQIAEMDALYRNRLRSLQAVDEAVRAIYRRVESLGRLGNTYFVFSSDNGFHLGRHRLTDGKGTAYHEDLHVPLIVRGPGIPRGLVVDWLATLADLAPTFAAWAGVAPGGPVDGRSLVPVLGTAPPALWRQSLPISYWSSPKFVGVRTLGHSYARYPAFGARELYDMRNDSEQLRNVSGTASASLMTRLDHLTSDLAACAGAACVARENAAAP